MPRDPRTVNGQPLRAGPKIARQSDPRGRNAKPSVAHLALKEILTNPLALSSVFLAMKTSRFFPLVTVLAVVGGSSFARAEVTKAAPQTAGAAVAAVEKVAPPQVENGYLKLGFDQLASYPFTPPAFDPVAAPQAKPPTGEEQIPAAVKEWNGKKAVVTGFMVPVKMDKGLVTELLLMRNTQACCYGSVPNMNEWVVIKMKKGIAPLMDVPVAIYGSLKVGAMFENGYMTGLYELDGEKMTEVAQ